MPRPHERVGYTSPPGSDFTITPSGDHDSGGGTPTHDKGGMPQHNLDRDYPLLWARSKNVDYQERLGCTVSPLEQEIEAAMLELWLARGGSGGEGGVL